MQFLPTVAWDLPCWLHWGRCTSSGREVPVPPWQEKCFLRGLLLARSNCPGEYSSCCSPGFFPAGCPFHPSWSLPSSVHLPLHSFTILPHSLVTASLSPAVAGRGIGGSPRAPLQSWCPRQLPGSLSVNMLALAAGSCRYMGPGNENTNPCKM